jgi:hypothetical protein
MNETTITGENVEVVQTAAGARSAFSWGAAIAGAIAAGAVSFILMALGSGIGLSVASPYGSGPSASTLTIAGAVWLVLAQTAGFAAGGFIAGRLRLNSPYGASDESTFRDGAHGFMAWAIGVVFAALVLAGAGALSLGAAARAGSAVTAGSGQNASNPADTVAYFVDELFRTNLPAQGNANIQIPREEVVRIVARSVTEGRLPDADRAYLAGLVAARTGVSPEDASRRVDDVENRVRESVRQAAETARKAAAYLSFWTFMALLFGAVAASLGGVLGGEMREQAAAVE